MIICAMHSGSGAQRRGLNLAWRLLLSVALLAVAGSLSAGEIRAAVASNFRDTMDVLAEQFRLETGHKIVVSNGSTGKHYTQIINGAPFDLFFAADAHRPELLEQAGKVVNGSRFTYAIGRIVLWSARHGVVVDGGTALTQGNFKRLAIANPKLAPYGQAAEEILTGMGLWQQLSSRLVRGENIAQTFQYVSTGNAQLGFVAYAQVLALAEQERGSYWLVPQSQYSPIEQQAVILRDSLPAREFFNFLKSESARKIIHRYGYGTP